jgi:predicted negative regulator of RcsB-dependent stress response
VSHNKIGDVESAQGDLVAARAAYASGLSIMQRLAQSDPGNAQWQRDLSVSHNNIGDVARAQGDLVAARAAYASGLSIMQRLAQSDPSNQQWKADLGRLQSRMDVLPPPNS